MRFTATCILLGSMVLSLGCSNSSDEIREIGKKMEDSISEYFYRAKLDDPTANFDWEYILIDKKIFKKIESNKDKRIKNYFLSDEFSNLVIEWVKKQKNIFNH